jgi:hypothetical protein
MRPSKIYGFFVFSLLIGVILIPIPKVKACNSNKWKPRTRRSCWWRRWHLNDPPEEPPEDPPEEPPEDPPEEPPEDPPSSLPEEPKLKTRGKYHVHLFYDLEYMVGQWFMPPNEYVVISLRDVEYNGTEYEILVTIINSENATTMNKLFKLRTDGYCLIMYIGALRFSPGTNTLTATLDGEIIHSQIIEE